MVCHSCGIIAQRNGINNVKRRNKKKKKSKSK